MEERLIDTAVRIRLLGGFEVAVGDRVVGATSWPSTRAAQLVQVLALADDNVLARDQVIEALWPHLHAEAGAANLRKAAHLARRTLGTEDAVVLRRGQVALFPSRALRVDVEEFVSAAHAAALDDNPDGWRIAEASYGGELLPGCLYEEWTQLPRRQLRARYLDVLRRGRQWERIVDLEPTDELASRELMRAAMTEGNRLAAVRWYGRLRASLRHDLGVSPAPETEALYDECAQGIGVAEPTFVGRQLELARAAPLLQRESAISLLLVRGPGGIGKSAFCRELAGMARRGGWVCLETRASPGAVPYAAAAALVEEIITGDRALLHDVGAAARATLSELTPLVVPAELPAKALTRHQVIGAIRRLLVALAREAGVILVVDDVDAADEATLDVLGQLVARGAPTTKLVLAHRPERSSEALDRLVSSLARSGRTLALDVGALPDDEAAALVRAAAPVEAQSRDVEAVVRVAGGNPFFLAELAQKLDRETPMTLTGISDIALARFVDIAEPHAAMLGRLALADADLDPTEVVALTGASEQDAYALLDVALTAGVLVVNAARYQFRHELIRQALAERLSPHQRIAVHRDTARRLERAGAAPSRIARHWLDGQRPDAATDWLLAAARQALRLGAFADALGHLDVLLAHVRDQRDALCLRAEALDALGQGGAPAAYAAAAATVDDSAAADLRAKQALAQLKLGDFRGALQTVDGLEPVSLDGRLARALTLSGVAAIGLADPRDAMRHAAESRRFALELGDPTAVVAASWAQALAAHACGTLRDSLRFDVRDTSSLPNLAIAVFDGQLCVTQRLLYGAAPYPDVIQFADSLAAEADRLGATRGRAFAVTLRGEAHLLGGQLADAEHDLVEAGQLHRSIAASTGEAHTLQRRAELAVQEGRRADADRLLDEALQVADASNAGFHLFDRIYGTAIAAADSDDCADAAMALLDESEMAIRGPVESCPGCRITLAVPAAIASAHAGALDRAASYADLAATLARVVMQLPAWDAALDEVNGHLAAASGDSERGARCFRGAAQGFHNAGQPLDEARCAALARE